MMWADRAGIGLCGIALIAVGVLFFSGFLGPLAGAPAPPISSVEGKPPSLPASSGKRLLTDQELGIDPPDKPVVIAAKTFAKLAGLVLMPIWLILRIGDWVFGGPARRQRVRLSLQGPLPPSA